MRAIHRKLLRELGRLRGQIITIAVVLAAGVASVIMLRGTYGSLVSSRDAYYEAYRFGHVFAELERAPESLRPKIENLPGVAVAETRIEEEIMLPVEGMPLPVYGRLLSLPPSGIPQVNAVHLEKGRFPALGRADEVVVLESFAEAHGLEPGHHVPAVINGELRHLRIVGTALSPEFVYAIRPGALVHDPKRVAVLWMERSALAAAFQLEGAFNDVSVRVQPGASEIAVRDALDRVLRPYGGDHAIGRKDQLSHRILTGELGQLGGIASMVPLVFLGVTVFLVRLVLGRLIALQRPEIATLKSVGYDDREVGWHYMGLVAVVMIPGGALGVLLGQVLGHVVLNMYARSFRFPDLAFRPSFTLIAGALGVSLAAATLGAFVAVRAAVRLAPAVAMRPPAPQRYRRSVFERWGVATFLGPQVMMILRELGRRPLKSFMSAFGIAGATALVVLGRFGLDSVEKYMEGTVRREQRQDLAVTFTRPLPSRAVEEIAHIPGVIDAEPERLVPTRVTRGHRFRDSFVLGLPKDASLRQIVQRTGSTVEVPPNGVLLSHQLGKVLDARLGDRLTLELEEGERLTQRPFVAGFVDDAAGLPIYARDTFVARLEGDLGAVSSVLIRVDPNQTSSIVERLTRSPLVLDVSAIRAEIDRQRAMHVSVMNTWTSIAVLMAMAVVFGVVYNNARIALATRGRDLALLRVLGFSRREISTVLLGGLAVELAIALPLGLWLGTLWARQLMGGMDPDTFRWSPEISASTYALAAVVTLTASALSALWVRRRLDNLDLLGVLKSQQ